MAVRPNPRRWGIVADWSDARGVLRRVEPPVIEALLRAMKADAESPPQARVRIVRPGAALPRAGEITLEDGTALGHISRLPRDVPFGYHRLTADGDAETLLLVGPGICQSPPARPAWGWTTQLYATRSRDSWGMGDLRDLRRLGDWSASVGASVLLVSPIHAATPPSQPSPYFPSSRRFRNPIYLAVEEVPGAERCADAVARAAAAGRELNAMRRIDRDAAWRLKVEALETIWRSRPGDEPGLDAYRREAGAALRDWSCFSTIAEREGRDWRTWPAGLRRPDGPDVAVFAKANADRVAFHDWLQWLLDRQLSHAAGAIGLIGDLPIGVDPGGADAWSCQELLTIGATIGAPPDIFNVTGQDWGVAPFNPVRLRAAGYAPFIETVRATLRHAGGLRLDHVMGLFRLWWIPAGNRPGDGAYVRYPSDELLEIVAIESARAGAIVIGEDLGTVEPMVRSRLAEANVLSYRLAWFEPPDPNAYPELSLAAVTTHDLPTIAGVWTGSDLADLEATGQRTDVREMEKLRSQAATLSGLRDTAGVDEVVVGMHAWLARVPSRIVAVTLEDGLAVAQRPNMPGTVSEWPNWSIPLPVPLEEIALRPLASRVAEVMRAERPSPPVEPPRPGRRQTPASRSATRSG